MNPPPFWFGIYRRITFLLSVTTLSGGGKSISDPTTPAICSSFGPQKPRRSTAVDCPPFHTGGRSISNLSKKEEFLLKNWSNDAAALFSNSQPRMVISYRAVEVELVQNIFSISSIKSWCQVARGVQPGCNQPRPAMPDKTVSTTLYKYELLPVLFSSIELA